MVKRLRLFLLTLAMMLMVTSPVMAATKLNKKSLVLVKGTSYQLKLGKVKGSKVKWASTNKGIVTVKKGKASAKNKGSATITARYKGKKYTCKVKVYNATIDGFSTMQAGRTQHLKVKGVPSDIKKKITYSSSDTKIAEVGKKTGNVMARRKGKVTIKVAIGDSTCKYSITVLGSGSQPSNAPSVTPSVAPTVKPSVEPSETPSGGDGGGSDYYTVYVPQLRKTIQGLISEGKALDNTNHTYQREAFSTFQTDFAKYKDLNADTIPVTDLEITRISLISILEDIKRKKAVKEELVYYPELSKQILQQINELRANSGLNIAPLVWSDNVALAARMQAGYNCLNSPTLNAKNLALHAGLATRTNGAGGWMYIVPAGQEDNRGAYMGSSGAGLLGDGTWCKTLHCTDHGVACGWLNSPGHLTALMTQFYADDALNEPMVQYGGVAVCSMNDDAGNTSFSIIFMIHLKDTCYIYSKGTGIEQYGVSEWNGKLTEQMVSQIVNVKVAHSSFPFVSLKNVDSSYMVGQYRSGVEFHLRKYISSGYY